MRNVNLGCGSNFIEGNEWVNLDFQPASRAVKKHNLLTALPFGDREVGLVYSSHFFEHIPRKFVGHFLGECSRIMEYGGVLRLVLPDFEKMARVYLEALDSGLQDVAEYMVMEIVDQCVRTEPGGEMGSFLNRLSMDFSEKGIKLQGFVRGRIGDFGVKSRESPSPERSVARRLSRAVLLRVWIRLSLMALPSSFREQNVSMSDVGERHQWLWDYAQLERLLLAAGFSRVTRATCSTSLAENFPFYPLDVDANGGPRKGTSSIFIEAVK